MQDQVEIDSMRAGLARGAAVQGNSVQSGPSALVADLPGGSSSSLPILPHILTAIFGVFAVAIVILWLSISVWSRPDPDHLAPAGAQLQVPANPSP